MIIADACNIWGQGVGSHAIVLLWLWMNVLMIIFEFLFHVSCYHNKGVLAPYGCHPSESTRSRGHGWRLPSPSMNYRYSMPFRQHFDEAIPAANRGIYHLLNKCPSWDFFHLLLSWVMGYYWKILRCMMITFQAQAFGDRGEQKLPGYEACHTSACPQASFDIFQQLVLLISLVECWIWLTLWRGPYLCSWEVVFFFASFCTGKKVSLESWQNLRRVWLWYARSVYN